MKRHWKKLIGRGLLAALLIALVVSQTPQHVAAANTPVTVQEIAHYVRERFGIPDNTKLTVAPIQDSQYTDFYQTTIKVQLGKQQKSQPAFVTKDGHYLVIGIVFNDMPAAQNDGATNASARDQKIVDFVRAQFHVPDAVKLSVGPFRDSRFEGFYTTTIYGQDGTRKTGQSAYMTKDGRYAVIGSIYNLRVDPRTEVEHTINLNNQASVGPADAPVTIVEYADLECPMCAETQKFFATQLIPKYGNKIRIIFKEFPLVTIHNWALTGAIANECGYVLNPADYFRFRSIIFASQDMITADSANARSLLLDMGQRAGYNRLKLAECIDSKATLPRIEADMNEGQELGVISTPTLFINGTPVVGFSPTRIYQLINRDLQAAK